MSVESTLPPARHLPRAVAAIAVLSFYGALFLFTFHEADEDVWGRLAVGRLIEATGHVALHDPFAYVPTLPVWVDHEWLSGLVMSRVRTSFGDSGLVWLRALAGLGAVGFVLSTATRRASPWASAALAVALAVLVLQGFNSIVRAQAFSFLFFAWFWWVLERNGRLVWCLVPASALWANLHGGVATGLLLVGAYAVCERERRVELTAVGVLATAATVLNPYGLEYWHYLARALVMPRPEIVEWRHVALWPALDDLHLKLAAMLVATLVLSGQRIRNVEAVVLGGTLVASFLHVRFAPFMAFAMVVSLPRLLTDSFARGYSYFPHRWVPSLVPLMSTVLLLSLTCVGVIVGWNQRDLILRMRVPDDRYPVSAVRRLEETGAVGRLAVFFNWGEYALYHLYPDMRVSIDGRYETVYPGDVTALNWAFSGDGSSRLLELYPADYALYPTGGRADEWLEASPEWQLLHRDDTAALYAKRVPP